MEKTRDFSVAIIYNSKGEFLLQKKTLDYPNFPGIWCLFGGEIEKGESPEQAIKREIKEEIGIELEGLKLFKSIKFKIKNSQGTSHIFFCIMKQDLSEIRLQEGAGFAFFSKEEISSINISETSKRAIHEFIKNGD